MKAPLSYQGGKQRVAEKLVNIIKGDINNTNYVDLCCGSGAISVELINQGVHPENILMVDQSDWGEFWAQVSNSTFDKDLFEHIIEDIPKDPRNIQDYLKLRSKEQWDYESEYIDIIPLWLCLQAGSFGGKHIWTDKGCFKNASFRSYWMPTETSSRRSPVNPMMPMPTTLKKQVLDAVDNMQAVKAMQMDVVDIDWDYYDSGIRTRDNVVIFIDPPYDNTTGYGFDLDYVAWYRNLQLPPNYQLWITDYKEHGKESYSLNKTSKGGISGGNKKREEILSRVF